MKIRDKPLDKAIKRLNLMLMKLMHERRTNTRAWVQSGLVPSALAHIEILKKHYGDYDYEGEVDHEITAIGASALVPMRLPWEGFCSKYYLVSSYVATYKGVVHSSNWGKGPGRPRKERLKDFDEGGNSQKKCGKCGMYGHNKKTCKGPPGPLPIPRTNRAVGVNTSNTLANNRRDMGFNAPSNTVRSTYVPNRGRKPRGTRPRPQAACVSRNTQPNESGVTTQSSGQRGRGPSICRVFAIETVCNLGNLQTLKLTSCKNLRRLPDEGLRKLVNLRHLELNYTYALECLPKGLQALRDFQTLTKFVRSEEGCKLWELSNLNNLHGSLIITNIKGSKESINDAKLKSKEHLCSLGLYFVQDAYEGKRDDDASVIELFEPHPNLENLLVWDYGGSKLPNWIEFQSSSIMLRQLEILECRNLEVLPPLTKLESLQYLLLQELDSMSPMGLFNGFEASTTTVAYPNLKKLAINDMKHWEEWVMETSNEDITIMPFLQRLDIYNCPMLKSLPHQILYGSVRNMNYGSVRNMFMFIWNCPELIISWFPPFLEELTLDGDAVFTTFNISPRLSQLMALQTLKVGNCDSLICIPDELQHLTSRKLVIGSCSILGPRCEKDVGEDWSIISHIPIIYIV
ncbi:hypothetical protein GIB67_005901 [Kingdonia uniflora]|uniref:R13L1/DRL21-like LRR repeat region domain-containing protein n=1 Tax=Kingdonia uniflora TaxID=39325 RepID=A0A7J7MBI9_9MAGN|nr:hypothetical protein GIB67_005901 [Kingdonia uniflora]